MADKIDIGNISKFDGKNYRQWKFQMVCALRAKGLFNLVNGTEVKPEDGAALERWNKQDAIAMFTLTTAMDLSQITLIENCVTSAEIINKLDSIYEQKSETNKMLVHERFHKYKMEITDSISQHIAKVENLAKQIRETGETVSDVAIMTKILGSLPVKYRNIRQAWLSMDETKQTIQNLTARLLDEEANLTSYEDADTALSVQNSKESTQRNSSKPNKHKNITCFNCQKKGHFASKCRAPKKPREEKSADQHQKKNSNKSQVNTTAFLSSTLLQSDDNESWVMDSGASAHMTYKRKYFATFNENADNNEVVKLGNNQELIVKGKGTVNIKKFISGEWFDSYITNVLYVPDLRKSLFSEGVITAKGMQIVKSGKAAEIYDGKDLVAAAVREPNNLYKMLFQTIISEEANTTSTSELQVWHERLGHINNKALCELISTGSIKNIEIANVKKFFCEACQYGKQHKLPIKSKGKRITKPGEFIHTDVCGPMSTPSVQGANYYILFVDDCTGYRVVSFMKHKSDSLTCFQQFAQMCKNKFNESIKILHCDNGTEYINNEFKTFLSKSGITLETTAPYTPEQNGKAERENRTIVESARSMLYTKDIPTYLWAEAVNTAVYILNRTPNVNTPKSSPFEKWTGQIANLEHLKTFGCEAYMHVPKELRNKLASKSSKLMFVGYHNNSTNYRLFDVSTRKIKISRNVTFNENTCTPASRQNTVRIDINEDHVCDDHNDDVDDIFHDADTSLSNDDVPDDNIERDQLTSTSNVPTQSTNSRILRNRNNIKLPARFNDHELNLTEIGVPESYEQAMQSDDADEWSKSIDEELAAIAKNNVWDVVSLPPGKHTIGSRWVFRVKRHPNGTIERYKTRLCAKGFAQEYGIDYTETFSPTTRFDSIRLILSIAAQYDYEIKQFDVKTAFLYGDLEDEIYLKPPDGTNISSDKVCKLNKSLYGLKQAPYCWNKKFSNFLKEFGFVQSNSDKCVYRGIFNATEKVLLLLYVDDGLIFTETKETMDVIVKHLTSSFDVRISEPNYFVGMQIERNRCDRTIFIHQTSYINNIIERFGFKSAKSVSVPADPHTHLSSVDDQNEEIIEDVPYRELVGSLIFAATVCRPDISYAVGVVSRYLQKHTNAHWNAVKRIVKYLIGTTNYGIKYKHTTETDGFVAYSDSDYANDLPTRRSTTGYICVLNGGPITWCSKRQRSVSLSTTEAEYMASCEATKEIIWLRQLIRDIDYPMNGATKLFVDNQSAIRLVHNPDYHKRTKHIDVRYHFIRERLQNNEIDVQYKCTEEQHADILTKALLPERFRILRNSLSIKNNF